MVMLSLQNMLSDLNEHITPIAFLDTLAEKVHCRTKHNVNLLYVLLYKYIQGFNIYEYDSIKQ